MRCSHTIQFTVARAVMLLIGCLATTQVAVAQSKHHHKHHADEGPHHGQLIQLKGANFQAELVHDEKTHLVTVYLLDQPAQRYVVIDAEEIVIVGKFGNQPMHFALKGSAEKNQPSGRFSKYVLRDAKLGRMLHQENSSATLNLSVAGTTFAGRIDGHHHHDHDHEQAQAIGGIRR